MVVFTVMTATFLSLILALKKKISSLILIIFFVDKNGFLIAVMVCVANIHNSKAGLLLLRLIKEELVNFKCILADAGYRGDFLDKA
jgi:hypothetical protein